MPRIGVFGLMASGKSSVSEWFREWGAALVDGDALGWEVLREPNVVRALAEAFGAGVLDASGAIDRGRLGRVVFTDQEAMRRLNQIVQPVLLKRVRADLASSKAEVVVLDAAMLTTWGLEPELDGVLEIRSGEAIRAERLMNARGITRAESLERIRGQRLPAVAHAKRHWVLENDGDREALRRGAAAVWSEIGAHS
jgi:dephospho-CoA kinase